MAQQQQQTYRLRIRSTLEHGEDRWIIARPQYSYPRVLARAEALREAGHVVNVDLAEWYR